jgi:hypothetical protein
MNSELNPVTGVGTVVVVVDVVVVVVDVVVVVVGAIVVVGAVVVVAAVVVVLDGVEGLQVTGSVTHGSNMTPASPPGATSVFADRPCPAGPGFAQTTAAMPQSTVAEKSPSDATARY